MSASTADSSAVATAFAQIVGVVSAHPWASLAVGLFVLLILCVRKDGVVNRYLTYLEAKATLDASLENRRIEIMRLVESREQLNLPGIKRDAEGDR